MSLMQEYSQDLQIVKHPNFDFKNVTDFEYYKYARLEPKPLPGLVGIQTRREQVHLKDGATGIIIPQSVNFCKFFEVTEKELDQWKTGEIPMPDFKPDASTDTLQKIYRYTNLKFQCVGCAEILNESLRGFLIRYSNFRGLRNLSEIYRLDFSGLRDMLSPIIKKDKDFHTIPFFDTAEKRSMYTKVFADFISDRNLFTHGILYYFSDEDKFYLNYVVKIKHKDDWAHLTDEMLQSFFWVSEQLRNPISALGERINQLKKQR